MMMMMTMMMMMVAVSRMDIIMTEVVIVEAGTKYYCDNILHQRVLPSEIMLPAHKWTLQQDGAPSHAARNMQCDVQFIDLREHGPPNSPDLNPTDYAI